MHPNPEQRVTRLHTGRVALQQVDVGEVRWQWIGDEYKGLGGRNLVLLPIVSRDRDLVSPARLEAQQRHGMRRAKIIEAPLPGPIPIID